MKSSFTSIIKFFSAIKDFFFKKESTKSKITAENIEASTINTSDSSTNYSISGDNATVVNGGQTNQSATTINNNQVNFNNSSLNFTNNRPVIIPILNHEHKKKDEALCIREHKDHYLSKIREALKSEIVDTKRIELLFNHIKVQLIEISQSITLEEGLSYVERDTANAFRAFQEELTLKLIPNCAPAAKLFYDNMPEELHEIFNEDDKVKTVVSRVWKELSFDKKLAITLYGAWAGRYNTLYTKDSTNYGSIFDLDLAIGILPSSEILDVRKAIFYLISHSYPKCRNAILHNNFSD